MFRRDAGSALLGIQLVEGSPGAAVVRMTVRPDMLNGFDLLHGGLLFALGDTAFGYACNESDSVTLGTGADIAFLRPVRVGQTLTAVAERRQLVGRSGIYDVTIADETGAVVAVLRGRSRVTGFPVRST